MESVNGDFRRVIEAEVALLRTRLLAAYDGRHLASSDGDFTIISLDTPRRATGFPAADPCIATATSDPCIATATATTAGNPLEVVPVVSATPGERSGKLREEHPPMTVMDTLTSSHTDGGASNPANVQQKSTDRARSKPDGQEAQMTSLESIGTVGTGSPSAGKKRDQTKRRVSDAGMDYQTRGSGNGSQDEDEKRSRDDNKSIGSSSAGDHLMTRGSMGSLSTSASRRRARVPKNLPRGIVHPEQRGYKLWSRFISLLIIFTIFYTPLQVAFMDREAISTMLPPLMVDCCFFADMAIQFNLAIDQKAGCITERAEIAMNYARSGRLFTDIISTVPFGIAFDLFDGFPGMGRKQVELMSLILALLPMARVYRILIMLRAMQQDSRFNLLGVVVGKVVLFILISTHTAGCIFYAIARLEDFDEETWIGVNFMTLPDDPWTSRYIHVLYWAVATFKAGPASGDLHPVSEQEMMLACCSMVVNICLQTYLVSSMSALLTTADLSIYAFRRKLRQVMEFASQRGLPRSLREHVKEYLAFKFSANDELEHDVLSALPELYRQRISHALYKDIIMSLPTFRGCANIFLWQVHGVLQAAMHAAQHNLIGAGEPATKLHILAKGEVGYYSNDELCETRHRGEGIGEIPFICKKVQPFTVNTHVACRVLSINREDWETLVSTHAEAAFQIKQNLEEDCIQRLTKLEEGVLRVVYAELLKAIRANMVESKEATVSALIFATARGDLGEMRRLLVGHTADCADYDLRTPLHIASANGFVEACGLLIDHTANVNCVDKFGRTPLLEACRSRQLGAGRLLFMRGARLGFSDKMLLESQLPTEMDTGYMSQTADGTESASGTESITRSQIFRRRSRKMEVAISETNPESLADIHAKHIEGGELCQAASDVEQLWYLQALLQFGADCNAGDYDARTALHVSCASGNKPAVEQLLAQDEIDVNVRDNFGRTPLMEAVRHENEPCARLLRSKGASHGFIEDLREATANSVIAGQELCQAAFANQKSYLFSLVVHCGITVDAADYDLRTALMLACAEGNSEVAITLVQHKADIERKDRWGHTAITEARSHGHTELAKLLEQMVSMSTQNQQQ